jgi:hypothetical protein
LLLAGPGGEGDLAGTGGGLQELSHLLHLHWLPLLKADKIGLTELQRFLFILKHETVIG